MTIGSDRRQPIGGCARLSGIAVQLRLDQQIEQVGVVRPERKGLLEERNCVGRALEVDQRSCSQGERRDGVGVGHNSFRDFRCSRRSS